MARQGIYFGLDEANYHSDPALGSSSMKQLAASAPDYWFNSPHNPMREEQEDKPAQVLGSAYHVMVMYGRAEFEKRYGIKQFNWSTKEGKAERAEFEAAGRVALSRDDWNRIMISDASISANPSLVNAFKGGPTEVSIFWEQAGVPKKARIDCLKIGANSDLKTISPKDETTPFVEACRKAMASYLYHVQAAHYAEGRHHLSQFIAEGKVFGDHDRDLLAKIASRSDFSSVFVFLKKTHAPLTWACMLSPKNPLLEEARGTIMRAEETYRTFKEKFGMDTPWLTNDPIEELHPDDMPNWRRVL